MKDLMKDLMKNLMKRRLFLKAPACRQKISSPEDRSLPDPGIFRDLSEF